MSTATLCATCKKDLSTCETVFAAEGLMYCSRTCGICNFEENAVNHFDEVAEEVNPEDIGLRMSKEQILEAIHQLAASRGFYSRLYNNLMEMTDSDRDEWLCNTAKYPVKDTVDLILLLEV